MIIDLNRDPITGILFIIVDAETGETIPQRGRPIVYADDVAGIYRVLLRDENGDYFKRSDGKTLFATEEIRRPIRIVPAAGVSPKRDELAAKYVAEWNARNPSPSAARREAQA